MTTTRPTTAPLTVWPELPYTAGPVLELYLDEGEPRVDVSEYEPAGADGRFGRRSNVLTWGGAAEQNGAIPDAIRPAIVAALRFGRAPGPLVGRLVEEAPPVVAARLSDAIR